MAEDNLSQQPRSIDDIPDLEFMGEFVAFFGIRRASMLVGWSVLLGVEALATGQEISNTKMRDRLTEQGLSRSEAYRALADLAKFGQHLEGKPVELRRLVSRVGRAKACAL